MALALSRILNSKDLRDNYLINNDISYPFRLLNRCLGKTLIGYMSKAAELTS